MEQDSPEDPSPRGSSGAAEDTFTLTVEVTELEFVEIQPEDFEPWQLAEETEALPEGFTLPPLEIGFEEPQAPHLPAWLDAYLEGRRIAITPENGELFQQFVDAQADTGSLYYTHPAVVGSGLMAQDIFDILQT